MSPYRDAFEREAELDLRDEMADAHFEGGPCRVCGRVAPPEGCVACGDPEDGLTVRPDGRYVQSVTNGNRVERSSKEGSNS